MRGSAAALCNPQWRSLMRRIGLLLVLTLLVAPAPVRAQSTTLWGDPDLQGLWNNQTPIQLERPDGLAGKAVFTQEEAVEVEAAALDQLLSLFAPGAPLGAESELSGELTGIWLETASGKIAPGRHTSLVTDPPDGKIPYTPAGKTRWEALPTIDRIIAGGEIGANGPEDRDLAERCLLTDGVLIPNPFYNNHHHIVQTPQHVAILTEMMHEVRIIPLDQPQHAHPNIGQWLGDSRGRWEGQTLVVETTNFNGKRLFRGATEELRLVERFTRLDANTIRYELTVTDPATFARPWTLENSFWKAEGPLYEVACHEGNYGLAGILSGARAEEQR